MVLGVSVAAYGAGLFHLMTHAFFKALLFMGAGSVIGAMAGLQNMYDGRLAAMPFTFITFTAAARHPRGVPVHVRLLLQGRDTGYTLNRGGGFVVLAIAGYLGAALTGFYAFRMVFRVFGEPVPEARELEGGHCSRRAHEPHDRRARGHRRGLRPEHAVAERSWPMKFAMAPSRCSRSWSAMGIPA